MNAIECRDVAVFYGRRAALWGVTCQVPLGCLAAVVGPNGAGKSTFLRAVAGLLPVQRGEIRLFARPIAEVRSRISYMPQRESVDWDFPLTVLDVVLMGRYGRLKLFQRPGRLDYERAWEALRHVGMEQHAHRQLGELSGGQQQRVFLARALAYDADLYLMDEPFAGIDAATEQVLLEVVHELRDAGKTVVVVHHDLQVVASVFEWVMLLNLHMIAAGPVGEVLTAQHLHEAYGGRSALLSEVVQRVALHREVMRRKGA
ncbi:MAG: metal ABC transporter ATP-binding protein [Candidatus Kapabacteria bacterium]|nr:metal ABC transporter ATP-binding protein [Candidatus Kapabacteria bacterium]MDW8225583.1 metal ABC transporter ATP-binding protein [Bacteroidota bacterium]